MASSAPQLHGSTLQADVDVDVEVSCSSEWSLEWIGVEWHGVAWSRVGSQSSCNCRLASLAGQQICSV